MARGPRQGPSHHYCSRDITKRRFLRQFFRRAKKHLLISVRHFLFYSSDPVESHALACAMPPPPPHPLPLHTSICKTVTASRVTSRALKSLPILWVPPPGWAWPLLRNMTLNPECTRTAHSSTDCFDHIGSHQCSAGSVASWTPEFMPSLDAPHLWDKYYSATATKSKMDIFIFLFLLPWTSFLLLFFKRVQGTKRTNQEQRLYTQRSVKTRLSIVRVVWMCMNGVLVWTRTQHAFTQTYWVVCHPCSHKHAIHAHSHNSHCR